MKYLNGKLGRKGKEIMYSSISMADYLPPYKKYPSVRNKEYLPLEIKWLKYLKTSHQKKVKHFVVVVTEKSWRTYMTQIRDDSTFTSNGGINKLKYIDQHFVAFEARDLIISFSKNSAIMIFIKI